jgi:hypothetical protein
MSNQQTLCQEEEADDRTSHARSSATSFYITTGAGSSSSYQSYTLPRSSSPFDTARQNRPLQMNIVQEFFVGKLAIFWIDENRSLSNERIERRSSDQCFTFTSVNECIDTLHLLKNRQLFCIVQNNHADSILPYIEQRFANAHVYIFCIDMSLETKWYLQLASVKAGGVFDSKEELIEIMIHDIAKYTEERLRVFPNITAAMKEEFMNQLSIQIKQYHNVTCNPTKIVCVTASTGKDKTNRVH